MSEKTEEFFRIMQDFLPSISEEYRKSIETYGQILETVIIEDTIMPKIVGLLSSNKDVRLLEKIFNYFEEVANCGDEDLINTLSITALEILGNDKAILSIAQKYMGPKTTRLQIDADRAIGRS